MADDTEDQVKEPDTDAAGNEPNQPTGDSGQKPPWERDGEEFSPEKAWNLIRNLRADNAKLKESDDAKAVKLREIEDANLSEKEKADRDLKEAREQLDAIRTQKAWAEAMAEHQCLTKEDFDLIGAGSPQEVREKAAKLVAGELKRVRETYDPGAIWGGSYGWMRTSSVGNARNLLQRVLNLNGGNTTYTGDYSTGCAQVVLPYVIGSNGVYEQVTSWELINEKTELVVLWGADPTITNDIDWCTTIHENAGGLRALKARGVKVVAINPLKPDTAECFGDKAQGIAPRPGTDVAMMLGSTSRACASGSSPK